jgi:hypothetical protein
VTTNGFAVNVTSASAPSALTVSYMLFSPSTAGYASYGGIIDQPLVPNSTYISVFKSLSSLQNYIYGINGFAFGSAPNINISTSIDKSFVLAIQPGQIVTNLTVAYIIYGMSPKYVCLNCPNTLPNFDGNCASQLRKPHIPTLTALRDILYVLIWQILYFLLTENHVSAILEPLSLEAFAPMFSPIRLPQPLYPEVQPSLLAQPHLLLNLPSILNLALPSSPYLEILHQPLHRQVILDHLHQDLLSASPKS